MTQYPKLLCMLVCLAVLDKALTGSNMGMRILKRDHGQIRRSNPTMNLVNNLKSNLCIIFSYFQDPILLPSPSTGYGDAVRRPEGEQTRQQEGPLCFFHPVNGRAAKTWYPGQKFKKLFTFWEHDIVG